MSHLDTVRRRNKRVLKLPRVQKEIRLDHTRRHVSTFRYCFNKYEVNEMKFSLNFIEGLPSSILYLRLTLGFFLVK